MELWPYSDMAMLHQFLLINVIPSACLLLQHKAKPDNSAIPTQREREEADWAEAPPRFS